MIKAKPLIDILVDIDDLCEADDDPFQRFADAVFLRLRVKRLDEIVLAKFTDDTYQEKTHYIHLVEYEGGMME